MRAASMVVMRAKVEERRRARDMRVGGATYAQISAALGVSTASCSLWLRDLPRPPVDRRAHSRAMVEARWAPRRAAARRLREETERAASAEVGEVTPRELFLIGVALYWAEGTKDKAHLPRRRELVAFTNSDPRMVRVYLAWLALLRVERERLRFRVAIHETADVGAAESYWADVVGVPVHELQRTTLKRSAPTTNRLNTGREYHGCLVVRVLGSADLYRRIEGWWTGIVGSVEGGTR